MRCFTSSQHRPVRGLRHATTAHTSEMCKEAWASVVLRFSFSLPSLVLRFSLPVTAPILCLLLYHLAAGRKGQKRLALRTTKARTTNELAFQSPFASNVPRPGIEQNGYWKFDVGTSIVRNNSPLFLPAIVKAIYGFVLTGDSVREATRKAGTRRAPVFDAKKKEEAGSNSIARWMASLGRTRKIFSVPVSGVM